MMNKSTPSAQACCTTTPALLFWGSAFVAAFVPLTLVALYYWPPLSAAALPFAIGIGCVANWLKNRTDHCVATGPLFLLGGAVLLMTALGMMRVSSAIVWGLVVAGTIVAVSLEARFAQGKTPT